LRPIDGTTEPSYRESGIFMVHHGYLPEHGRVKDKTERNERLLLKELENNPDNPYLLYQLGKSFFVGERDLQKACEYFEKALNAGADVKVGYTYDLVECYGYALLNTEQYEKALILRDTYSVFYDEKVKFRFLTAHIYMNNCMFTEAVECFDSCIDADITDKSGITSYLAYYNIGIILECVEMLEDAIAVYKCCGNYEPALTRLAELSGGR